MVEALVAIPFFIIVFAAGIYIGDVYGKKMSTMRAARLQAWTHASGNCEGDAAQTGYAGGPDLGQNGDGDGNPGEGAPGSAVLDAGYDEARSTVEDEAEASGVLGGTKQKVQTKTAVLCNEKPADGNIIGVFKYIGANLSPWDP
jgi:hypothetical protein